MTEVQNAMICSICIRSPFFWMARTRSKTKSFWNWIANSL